MAIGEMEIGEGATISYTALTSCLTLTCVFSNGTLMGAHFVHDRRGEIPALIDTMAGRVGQKTITAVWIVGVQGCWNDDKGLPGKPPINMNDITAKVTDKLSARIDTKSTSGKSELVAVTVANDTSIKVTVQYPAGKTADGTDLTGDNLLARRLMDTVTLDD